MTLNGIKECIPLPPISLSKNTLPLQLLLTIHCADHSVKSLDEWQLKRSLTDFLKSSFSLTVPEDDIVVRKFKDLKKRKRDDPVAQGALFICDLGFLSKFSRSEILHGIDGEDDVKEREKKFLDWRRSVVGKTDGIELNLEGVKFRLTVSVPESDDFGMRKKWEELNAFGNRGYSRGRRQQQPDTIVLEGVPSRWFAEPRVSSKPSMLVTHTIFSAFGKIRCVLMSWFVLFFCFPDALQFHNIVLVEFVRWLCFFEASDIEFCFYASMHTSYLGLFDKKKNDIHQRWTYLL
ncbi:uncharacterized protein LOC114315920 [Camellia sinensis]|uniref:uncharacterized protein LOC114315920 n=1 Tax=Camellia sinensis TaxID=4442 RepID=UPI001036D198|nr:uncharacterized protein LOC114315920 [Camellia sinensis]